MPAQLLEGAKLAATLRAEITREVAQLQAQGRTLCLAAVLVGDQPETLLHVKSQQRACEKVGITFRSELLPGSASQAEVMQRIEVLNRDPGVHGIILQLPLPARIDARLVQRSIDPRKDAEGVHPVNLGMIVYGMTQRAPCTALAAYHLIKSTGVELYGKEAVVIGHSQIVGKPIGLMLLHDFCTLTVCHIATRDLAAHTRRADILVVAIGKPRKITAEMIKPGALVVDIGVNQVEEPGTGGGPATRRIVGDVDFEPARQVAGWITPVPGGVGPLTVATLLRNVVEAGREAAGIGTRLPGTPGGG